MLKCFLSTLPSFLFLCKRGINKPVCKHSCPFLHILTNIDLLIDPFIPTSTQLCGMLENLPVYVNCTFSFIFKKCLNDLPHHFNGNMEFALTHILYPYFEILFIIRKNWFGSWHCHFQAIFKHFVCYANIYFQFLINFILSISLLSHICLFLCPSAIFQLNCWNNLISVTRSLPKKKRCDFVKFWVRIVLILNVFMKCGTSTGFL